LIRPPGKYKIQGSILSFDAVFYYGSIFHGRCFVKYNIKNIGIPSCLTGPIARGDISTIDKHISSIRKKEPDILSLYGKLGLKTIPIALAKGTIDEDGRNKLQALLEVAARGIE